MQAMIEPSASRLFDMYYRYTTKADLPALQSLTEEAYKLHERLRKLPAHKNGLIDLDEFLLLKALHYSVHRADFVAKAYAVNRQFAQRHNLDLQVCLVDKKTVHLAINAEFALENGAQEKIAKIQAQLVDFGDAFNIEPVIFNFMVKVYEKLNAMQLSIPGKGYVNIDVAYKNEAQHNQPHYSPLKSVSASNDEILSNITLLAQLNTHEFDEELPPALQDTFNEVSALDINLSGLKPNTYTDDNYKLMHDLLFEKMVSHPNFYLITRYLPKQFGVAILPENKNKEPEITPFDIQKQKAAFEAAAIQLDPAFYQTTIYELLVMFIFKGKICPVIISKTSLFEFHVLLSQRIKESRPLVRTSSKLGRNGPCPCGSGKKYKKCCLQ